MQLDNENTEIKVIPFSNGSEFEIWRKNNCDKCAFDYDHENVESSCELEEALSLYELTLRHARQIGCGELRTQTNGAFVTLNRKCSKFQCPQTYEAYGNTSLTLNLFDL